MEDERRGTLREIAWAEVFPWLILLRVFRIAIQVRMLLLGAIGLLMTMLGWSILAWLFSGTDDPALRGLPGLPQSGWLSAYGALPGAYPVARMGPPALPADGFPMGALPLGAPLPTSPRLDQLPTDPVLSPYQQLSAPLRQLFNRDISLTAFAFLLLCALWVVAIWAFIGGTITRIAAVQLVTEGNTQLKTAMSFARKRWRAYFAAPLFPLIGVLLILVFVGIPAGLIMRFDVGAAIIGLVWFLLLLVGLMMTIITLGLLFGWPLLAPAISTEGTDSFDALSRAYSFAYQRPLHYLFYVLVAAALGSLGYWLVLLFGNTVVYLALWCVSFGAGAPRMQEVLGDSSPLRLARSAIAFWSSLVFLLVNGFAFSYFYTAATAIYVLLRRDVDGKEIDELDAPDPLPAEPSLASPTPPESSEAPGDVTESALAMPGRESGTT